MTAVTRFASILKVKTVHLLFTVLHGTTSLGTLTFLLFVSDKRWGRCCAEETNSGLAGAKWC